MGLYLHSWEENDDGCSHRGFRCHKKVLTDVSGVGVVYNRINLYTSLIWPALLGHMLYVLTDDQLYSWNLGHHCHCLFSWCHYNIPVLIFQWQESSFSITFTFIIKSSYKYSSTQVWPNPIHRDYIFTEVLNNIILNLRNSLC